MYDRAYIRSTHGIIVLVVPGADYRPVVGPNDPVRYRHGRGDALQPDRVGWRPVLDPRAADHGRPFHVHRDLGVQFAKARGGGFTAIPTRGRGRHDHRQVARRTHHL